MLCHEDKKRLQYLRVYLLFSYTLLFMQVYFTETIWIELSLVSMDGVV